MSYRGFIDLILELAHLDPLKFEAFKRIDAALTELYKKVEDISIVPQSVTSKRVASFILSTGNIGTGDDVLASGSTTPGLLSTDGDYLIGSFWGRTANNANAKTLRLHIKDGTSDNVVAIFTPTISELGHWFLGFRIIRVSNILGNPNVWMIVGPDTAPISKAAVSNTGGFTFTWTGATTIELTGEATADNDITMHGGEILYIPAG